MFYFRLTYVIEIPFYLCLCRVQVDFINAIDICLGLAYGSKEEFELHQFLFGAYTPRVYMNKTYSTLFVLR